MILVDSSVWIDWFKQASTPQTERLDIFIDSRELVIADLVLAEVLQGFRNEFEFERARIKLEKLLPLTIGGNMIAIQAARHYRALRAMGITVRKTIDTLIATRCIADGIPLLFSDKDFEPFVVHLGLADAMQHA